MIMEPSIVPQYSYFIFCLKYYNLYMTKKTTTTKRKEFFSLLEEKAIEIGTKILKGDSDTVAKGINNTAKTVTANVVKKSFVGMAIEKGKQARTKVIYKVLLGVAAVLIALGGTKVLLIKLGYGDYFALILGVLVLLVAIIFKLVNRK